MKLGVIIRTREKKKKLKNLSTKTALSNNTELHIYWGRISRQETKMDYYWLDGETQTNTDSHTPETINSSTDHSLATGPYERERETRGVDSITQQLTVLTYLLTSNC